MAEEINKIEEEKIEGEVETAVEKVVQINSLLENIAFYEKKYSDTKKELFRLKGIKILLEEKMKPLTAGSEEYMKLEREMAGIDGSIGALHCGQFKGIVTRFLTASNLVTVCLIPFLMVHCLPFSSQTSPPLS